MAGELLAEIVRFVQLAQLPSSFAVAILDRPPLHPFQRLFAEPTSMIVNPATSSFVSANGPSVTFGFPSRT